VREYETTFIVQPEISEEGCAELLTRIDGILEKGSATRLLHDDQGKRRLAYEIRKFQKGRYVTTYFLSEGEAVEPLERALRIEESVLRFLTVMNTEQVKDVEGRKAAAKDEEAIRAERARERAEREAEEDRARIEAAREAAAAAAAAAEEAAAAAEAAPATPEGEGEAAPESSAEDTDAAAPAATEESDQ
jgi:small subunit ribosomal protein S6